MSYCKKALPKKEDSILSTRGREGKCCWFFLSRPIESESLEWKLDCCNWGIMNVFGSVYNKNFWKITLFFIIPYSLSIFIVPYSLFLIPFSHLLATIALWRIELLFENLRLKIFTCWFYLDSRYKSTER